MGRLRRSDVGVRLRPGRGCEHADECEPVLARFLEREIRDSSEPIGVEIGFGVDVEIARDEPIRFAGFIDRVDRRAGSIEVLDYKSGRPRSHASVDDDLQRSGPLFDEVRAKIRAKYGRWQNRSHCARRSSDVETVILAVS